MDLTLAHIGPRFGSKDAFEGLTRLYLDRCKGFARCEMDAFKTEDSFFDSVEKRQGRTQPAVVLLDSRGRLMTSEVFASWLSGRRDGGAQQIVFAIGPASGWSDVARSRADLLLSFGPMTMAHALARLVLAEQIYRAFTILSGHPYHYGH